jgi:GABA(A) receptor-associated protein
MKSFKVQYSLEERMKCSENIRKKYEGRLPVIVEREPSSRLPDLPKKKFIVPAEGTVGKFILEIRKHLKIHSDTAIFVFVPGGVLPPVASQMGTIDIRYRDDDGFLYLTYTSESTFG